MREQYQVSKSQIQQIRDTIDIVGLISEYIPLKKAGLNFKGLCPFHKEKTPSFVVSQPKQIYHCFGCGAGGNAFDFVMKIQNIGFRETLSRLAERAGIELKEYKGSREKEEREKFFNVNRQAMEFFNKTLLDPKLGGEALKYLNERGVDKKIISSFMLGFAPVSWRELTEFLRSKNVNPSCADKLGLIIEKKRKGEYYDRFRGRVMFPIFNIEGKVIGFGGRTLGGDEAKYINSPESPVFAKRTSFYGLNSASKGIRENDCAIVVEGYMDLIALRSFGFENSVATLGTAFTMDHARVLKKFTDNVFITFDSDEAGVNAVKRTLRPVLMNSLTAKIIILPSPYDPDTFLRKHGPLQFKKLMDEALSLLDFYIGNYFQKEISLVGRAKVLEELRSVFQEIPNQFERELTIKKVSELTGIKESLFKERDEKRYFYAPAKIDKNRFAKEELLLTRFILEDAGLLGVAQEEGVFEYFSSEELKKFISQIVASAGNGRKISVNDLIDEVQDEELKRDLIQDLVKDACFSPDEARKAFRSCILRVKANYLKKKSMKLQDELMKAEKDGDEVKCRELLEEKKTLIEGKYRGR